MPGNTSLSSEPTLSAEGSGSPAAAPLANGFPLTINVSMTGARRLSRRLAERFQRFATRMADKMGNHWAFFIAVGVVAAWAITGPIFHFSDTWQLVINTGTTVVTFLMVFLIQSTQNRDAKAIHLKLDELIRCSRARNTFADLEHASDDELSAFQEEFQKLRKRGLAADAAATRARRTMRDAG